jgi:hypothetical protein
MKAFRIATATVLLLATLLISGGAAAPRSESAPGRRGPFLLVTLPSLGTVTWTCDTPERYPSFALGYRASPRYATTIVKLRASGRHIAKRTVQPGQRIPLPFLSSRTQTLSFLHATGAGQLRASVLVDFAHNTMSIYCQAYAPPTMTVRVSGRR